VCFRKGSKDWSDATLRVTPRSGLAVVYQLDRWD
jgi:hypothetical protein